jgi:hypothetical protein
MPARGGEPASSDRSGSGEREDEGAGIQGSGDRGADVYSLAQGVWRFAGGLGEAAQGA